MFQLSHDFSVMETCAQIINDTFFSKFQLSHDFSVMETINNGNINKLTRVVSIEPRLFSHGDENTYHNRIEKINSFN